MAIFLTLQDFDTSIKIVKFSGEWSTLTLKEVDAVIRPLLKESNIGLVFDWTEMNYINSSGVGSLVEYHREARKNKNIIVLNNVCSDVMTIIRTVGIDRLFPICKTIDESIKEIKKVIP